MIKNEYFCEIIETEFNKPLNMTKNDHEDFENSNKCWICKKKYEEDKIEVTYHDHISVKYQGS